MKKLKNVFAMALLCAVFAGSALSLASCGANKSYTFEAECATLSGSATAKSKLTDDGTNTEKYAASGAGCVEALSCNSATGGSVEWTFTSKAATTADLTGVMASRLCTSWTDDGITLADLTLKDNVSITVNGTALDLTGLVVAAPNPATSNGKKVADGSALDGQWWVDITFGHTWRDVSLGQISLNAGENKIKITSLVQDEKPFSKTAPYVDCITLANVGSELTFTETDNLGNAD